MPKSKHLRSIYSYWKMKEITKMMCDAINKQNKINQKLLEDVEREHEQLIKFENKNKALMEKRNKEMVLQSNKCLSNASTTSCI